MVSKNDDYRNRIADFLRDRRNYSDTVHKQLSGLRPADRDAITKQPTYAKDVKIHYTVQELSEELSIPYASVRYALLGSVDTEIRKGLQPRALARVGIVYRRGERGIDKPTWYFDPEVVHSMNIADRRAVEVRINAPEPIVQNVSTTTADTTAQVSAVAQVECTRQHFKDTRYDRLIRMGGVSLGFVDGVLINESREAPVVGLYALSEVEVEILRQTFGYDYRTYDPVRE